LDTDVAYLVDLVTKLERTDIKHTQMMEYVNDRYQKLLTKYKNDERKIRQLQQRIKEIESEQEINLHHRRVVEKELANRGQGQTS